MNNHNKFSIFIFLIIFMTVVAVIQPLLFIPLKPFIPFLLGVIMFGIGLTLKAADFKLVFNFKKQIIFSIGLKYLILPPVTYLIAKLIHLPNEDIIGLLMVSAAPGGTAAAIMSFLAGANVALTVVLTFITTILAPLIMPTIIYIFLHKIIMIPFTGMATSIFWIVLFPLSDGLIVRKLIGEKNIIKIQDIIPWVSLIAVAVIISCVVALNHQRILILPMIQLIAVLLVNLSGIAIGYFVARKILKLDHKNSQSISFEYGLQDSGLAVVLASKFFGVGTALCGALYSVVQNISGVIIVKMFTSTKKS